MNLNLYCLISIALATAASPNLTISDLVSSQIYSEVGTIGFEGLDKKQLHPSHYKILHKEKRLVNFRSVWKKWCVSLGDEGLYRATKAKFETENVNFWELVNGECLFLGPMKWMEVKDIQECGSAPLLNVPTNDDPPMNLPKTIEHIKALIERTYDLGALDNLSFLARNANLKSMIQMYISSPIFNSKYWNVFGLSYFSSLEVDRMFPPISELNLANLPRVIRIIFILKIKKKPIEKFCNLLKQSPLSAYAEYLQDPKKLTWALFEEAYNAIPTKDHVTKIQWIRLNYEFISNAPEGEAVRNFLLAYPKDYPDYAIFSHDLIKYQPQVEVPDSLVAFVEDKTYSTVADTYLTMYDVRQQTRFLSWMLRELPVKEREPESAHVVPIVFGMIYRFANNSRTYYFPSPTAFPKLYTANNNKTVSISDTVEMALAYGFHLNLSPNGLKSILNTKQPFRNIFLAKDAVRRPIITYMSVDKNASSSIAKFHASDDINNRIASTALNFELLQKPVIPAESPKLSLSPKKPEDLTYVDLVNSMAFSGLETIGLTGEKALHPKHYWELHKEKRLLNFRPIWVSWCKSLKSKDLFDKAQKGFIDAGVDFWKVMNGECLFLGPMEWMTPDDIRACKCAPLLGVPFYSATIANAPRKRTALDNENDIILKLTALLDRTLELKGVDTFGFLNRDSVIIKYFNSLPWNHPHWNVLSPVGISQEMICLMLPPADQLNVANLPRVLRVISFLKLLDRYYNDLQIEDTADLQIEDTTVILEHPVYQALISSPLKDYADFLQVIKPVSCQRFKEAYNSIPPEDHVMRAYWIRANIKVFEQLPAEDEIKKWFGRYPESYPDFSIFLIPLITPFKFEEDVKIPEAALSVPSDDDYSGYAGELPIQFSLREQINIASWHLRSLPKDINSSCTYEFGLIIDSSFPSAEGYVQFINSSTDYPKMVDMALAYGFHLTFTKEVKEAYCNRKFMKLNPFFKHPSVIRGILEFLEDKNNASSHSVFAASSEVMSLINLCNGDLSTLSNEELTQLPTTHLLKYIRSPFFFLPEKIYKQVENTMNTINDERLWALFKGRSDEEVRYICQNLNSRFSRSTGRLLTLEIIIHSMKYTSLHDEAPTFDSNGGFISTVSFFNNSGNSSNTSSSSSITNPSATPSSNPSTPFNPSTSNSSTTNSNSSTSSSNSTNQSNSTMNGHSPPKPMPSVTGASSPNISEDDEIPSTRNDPVKNSPSSGNSGTSKDLVPEDEGGVSPIVIILLLLLVVGGIVGVVFFLNRRQTSNQQ